MRPLDYSARVGTERLVLLVLVLVPLLASVALAQPVQIRVVSLTSPASPGDDAAITIQTAPDASCSITVVYESGPSRARGLFPQSADSRGRVTWTWRVGTRTTPGRWPIIVTCSAGGRQGTLETAFVVR
jgi:hypothetical protein